jgi:hypothetical protein
MQKNGLKYLVEKHSKIYIVHLQICSMHAEKLEHSIANEMRDPYLFLFALHVVEQRSTIPWNVCCVVCFPEYTGYGLPTDSPETIATLQFHWAKQVLASLSIMAHNLYIQDKDNCDNAHVIITAQLASTYRSNYISSIRGSLTFYYCVSLPYRSN